MLTVMTILCLNFNCILNYILISKEFSFFRSSITLFLPNKVWESYNSLSIRRHLFDLNRPRKTGAKGCLGVGIRVYLKFRVGFFIFLYFRYLATGLELETENAGTLNFGFRVKLGYPIWYFSEFSYFKTFSCFSHSCS